MKRSLFPLGGFLARDGILKARCPSCLDEDAEGVIGVVGRGAVECVFENEFEGVVKSGDEVL